MSDLIEIPKSRTDKNESPGDQDSTPADMMVCSVVTDGVVCGETFRSTDKVSAKVLLNNHSMNKHRQTWDGKPTGKPGQKPKDGDDQPTTTPPKGAKNAEKKAATKAIAHPGPVVTDSNRAAVYQQSLATVGLLAHLAAGRWFDDYDLNVWTNGSGGLAASLDAVGEQNPGVRRTCDLLLAGGTGGAYVQLILALAMIGVPIAAHHGFLPAATGERFGAMVGVMATQTGQTVDANVPPPDAPPPGPNGTLPMSEWTYDEWREVLFAAPQNPNGMKVMTDMMNGNVSGPTVVTIPDLPGSAPMDIQEQHRGSLGTDNSPAEPDTIPAP
jgi:hypothetical protein